MNSKLMKYFQFKFLLTKKILTLSLLITFGCDNGTAQRQSSSKNSEASKPVLKNKKQENTIIAPDFTLADLEGNLVSMKQSFAGGIKKTLTDHVIALMSLHRSSLIKNDQLRDILKMLIPIQNFDQLKIPLTIISTDIESGEDVISEKGNLIDALLKKLFYSWSHGAHNG